MDSASPHQRVARQPPPKFLDQVEACLKFVPDPVTKPSFTTHKAMIPVSYNNNMNHLLGMGYQAEFLEHQKVKQQKRIEKQVESEERAKKLLTRMQHAHKGQSEEKEEKARFTLKQFRDIGPKISTSNRSPTKS